MAEEEKNEAEAEAEGTSEEEAPKKSKRGLFVGGGILGVIMFGWMAALMAVPGVEEVRYFEGPFVGLLSEDEEWEVTVNLSGGGGKQFLVMNMIAEFFTYEEPYFTTRITDPHFQRTLKDELIGLASTKAARDVLDPASNLIFLEEIRGLVEPILFPVHIGDAATPFDPDSSSGLRPGMTHLDATFHGPYYEHELHVDATKKTIQLGDGPVISFEGSENNLEVLSVDGQNIFVDVSRLDPEFVGSLKVGTFGRIRKILKDKFLVQ